MKPSSLHVEGTALAALRVRHSAVTGAAWDGLPKGLADRVAKGDDFADGPALLQLAWELVRQAPAADAAEREALLHLAFAVLVAAGGGSAHVPADLSPKGWLEEQVLAKTQPGDAARAVIHKLLKTGRIPASLEHLVGADGYRPLLLREGRLSLHRLDHYEGRIAARVGELLALPPLALPPKVVGASLAEVVGTASRKPTEEQQLAVLNAVHLPFSIISGGPGTGKTSIVVALLRLLVRLGVEPSRIALAAPTGKAAYRLGEALRKEFAGKTPDAADGKLVSEIADPLTLHRLLGYSPATDRFRHDEHEPLDQAFVIVDECSMADLFVMDQLLRACSLHADGKTRPQLLLLGDADQLPSVEAGAVFRDLVPPMPAGAAATPALRRSWAALVKPAGDVGRLPPLVAETGDFRTALAVRLSHSFRMDPTRVEGARILACARAIHSDDDKTLESNDHANGAPEVRKNAEGLTFSGVELLLPESDPKDPTEASKERKPPPAFFRRWYARHLDVAARRGRATDPLDLTSVFRFPNRTADADDVHAVARALDEAASARVLCLTRGDDPAGAATANAAFHEMRREELKGTRSVAGFLPGEPVIVLQNDYERMLFNGDQGLVLNVDLGNGKPALRAVFAQEASFVAFELEALAPNLAHAYALTVHKAQGSEVKYAAVLLPTKATPLLFRELLYTAVSRASTSVVLVGSRKMIKYATNKGVLRHSGLAARIDAWAREGKRGAGRS